MKILLVSPTLSIGGAEKQLIILANSFAQRNINVNICILQKSSNEFEALLDSSINVIKFNHSRFLNSIISLSALVYRENFDVVYASAPHVSYFLAALRRANLIKKLIIREPAPMINVSRDLPYRNFRNLIHGTSYNYADYVVAPTPDILRDLRGVYKIKDAKLSLINNSFFLDQQTRAKNLDKDRYQRIKNIIYCGRLSEEKGFSTLKYICEHFSNPAVNLTIFCDHGSSNKLQELQELVKFKKLKVVISECSHKEIFSNADLMLMPSRYEGFPNAMFEALYYGVHVLCTPFAPDIQSEFSNEGSITVTVDHNQVAFIETLNQMIEHNPTYKLSERVHQYVKDNTHEYNQLVGINGH